MSSMRKPAHPGEVLREYLPEDLGVAKVTRHLGVTRQALSALINGRASVSAAMALRLEAALGASAEMWLGMQTNFDLWEARKRKAPEVVRIVTSQRKRPMTYFLKDLGSRSARQSNNRRDDACGAA